jgi:hypothetical protein
VDDDHDRSDVRFYPTYVGTNPARDDGKSGLCGGEKSGHSAIGKPFFVDKKCLTEGRGMRGIYNPAWSNGQTAIGREDNITTSLPI